MLKSGFAYAMGYLFLTTKVDLGPGEKDSSSVLDNFQTDEIEARP